jgi:hypothetical protein
MPSVSLACSTKAGMRSGGSVAGLSTTMTSPIACSSPQAIATSSPNGRVRRK